MWRGYLVAVSRRCTTPELTELKVVVKCVIGLHEQLLLQLGHSSFLLDFQQLLRLQL
jgi:hypothetical protein